jgi:cell shape-determining protein MreC
MKLRGTLSKKHLLGLLLALSVATSLAGPRVARPLRGAACLLLAPIGDGPMYAVTELGKKLSADPGTTISAEEAKALRQENDYLARLAAYWQYERDSYRRRAEKLANFQWMYGPTQDLACELIPARVVAADALPYGQWRVVNSGSRKGVRPGSMVTTRGMQTQRTKALPPRLAVVESNALVGRIADSGAFTASLQLLIDPGFQIRGRIRRVISSQRPRQITVTENNLPRKATLTPANNEPIDVLAQGDGTPRLIVRHVKEYHTVLPGDLLVTDTEAEGLPTEIHVGKVVEVAPDTKDARRVTVYVEPAGDLANLRDVFILSPLHAPQGRSD